VRPPAAKRSPPWWVWPTIRTPTATALPTPTSSPPSTTPWPASTTSWSPMKS